MYFDVCRDEDSEGEEEMRGLKEGQDVEGEM